MGISDILIGLMKSSEAINILLERSELTVRRAGRFRYGKSYSLPRRYVDDYDLILIGQGSGWWEIEGLGRRRVRPGTIMLFSPRIAHGTAEAMPGPVELISIHFNLRIERGVDFFAVAPFRPMIYVKQWRNLYEQSLRIAAEWRGQGRLGRNVLVHDLTRSLLVEIVRRYMHSGDGQVATDSRVLEVLRRLDSEFAGPLTASDIGQWVNLSPSHLTSLFRRELGIAPTEALRGRRMREARRLLLGSSLSIKEIAHCSGFHDPLYFSRAFRRTTGMTPLNYRESAKNP